MAQKFFRTWQKIIYNSLISVLIVNYVKNKKYQEITASYPLIKENVGWRMLGFFLQLKRQLLIFTN